jgi:hypothetical protein
MPGCLPINLLFVFSLASLGVAGPASGTSGDGEAHWAFSQPVRSALPTVDLDWCRNAVDRIARARMGPRSWMPQAEASRAILIRRLSLDLRGLPASAGELAEFQADRSSGAYERLVDRFLASPRFGEHFAWGWMEAARFADTDGFQSDAQRHMWRWREWVIEAFNRNLPYDQFTIEQIAGDLLPKPTPDQILATGFNRNHRYDKGSGTIQAESLFENAADRLETTATVWLGLTMVCARCHDHKFDPITSREYFEMLAFFDQVPENGQAILFNSHPRVKTPTREQGQELRHLDSDVDQAQQKLTELEPQIAAGQVNWEGAIQASTTYRIIPKGLVNHFPLDDMEPKGKSQRGQVGFVPGVLGSAMKFDGRSYYEFDKKVGNLWGRDRFTVSFWFKADDLRDGVILSELNDPDDLRMGTVVEIKKRKLRFMLSSRWNYAVTWFELKEQLKRNHWYHFALTCDGRVQLLAYHVYLNGQEAPIRVIQDSAIDGKKIQEPLFLGYSEIAPGFRGAIDELRFYRRDLGAAEVAMLAVKQTIPQIAGISTNRRSPAQMQLIRECFLGTGASVEIRNAVANLDATKTIRREFVGKLPTTMVMVEGPGKRSHMRIRGQYDQLGARVVAATPKILPPMAAGQPRNRLGFARWLVDGRNPLTARVAVNRVWQHLFGLGFVETPENFGVQSPRPVQAELLDWLATEFVRSGWDLKALIRLIVTSSTYRQSSSGTSESWKRDPQNRFLSRGPRHRLSAAVLRDQALSIGGLLDGTVGGDSVFPHQPEGRWRLTSNRAYESSTGKDLFRRSLYTYWRRAIAPPSLFLFDAPDREFCSVGARRTNTPLQALAALNERGFVDAAQGLGRRMMASAGDLRSRLRFGLKLATSRAARGIELDVLQDAWNAAHNEFRNDRSAADELAALEPGEVLDSVELAAYVTVANVLLNLDTTLSKE